MKRLAVIIGVIMLLLTPGLATALTVDEVAKEVKCPTCSTPLNVSEAPVADDMKEFIALRIEQGQKKEENIDALVEEFGPSVLAVPPKQGFDLLAWLVPLGALLLGLALIPVIGRAWLRRARAESTSTIAPSADEMRRLDEELQRRRFS